MSAAEDLTSGKGHTDENFPVASALIAPRHRPVVLAFYRVARMADDIADHATAAPDVKLARLAEIEATLLGGSEAVAEAAALRTVLAQRGLSNQHVLDLLEAFRRDVTKTRYADWADLMDYCRYSASPVGRFMLDVHGAPETSWPASDALCSALQVINHLQDCGKDYREIDRVYVPLDVLQSAGLGVEALGAPAASPALRGVIRQLAEQTAALLATARSLTGQVRDARLSLEISVIQSLAEDLTRRLIHRDPLSERVHHRKSEALALALSGVGSFAVAKLGVGARAVGDR